MEATGEAKSMTLELLNLMTSDDDKCLQMVMKHCGTQIGLAEDLSTLRARLYQVVYAMCSKIFHKTWSKVEAVDIWEDVVRMLLSPTTITRIGETNLEETLICAHRGLNIKGKEALILDIRGCEAIVYTIKKFEGFFGAGRVTEGRLELP
ncbi:hypothetical protein BGX31_006052, partial [Mortierella sp. GBA43]